MGMRFAAQPPLKQLARTRLWAVFCQRRGDCVWVAGFHWRLGRFCGVLSVLSVFPKVAGFSMVGNLAGLRSGRVADREEGFGSGSWLGAGQFSGCYYRLLSLFWFLQCHVTTLSTL